MTKSQNTKNEQHCIKQNEKSFIQKDLSLTELWQKGELPDGYYYCKTENGVEILRTWRGINGYLNFENMCNEVFISSMDDCEVLAPVPSYYELQNMNKAVNECMAANIKLVEQNAQLKELLKECEKMLMQSNYQNMTQYHEVLELRDKINKIIGEK